MKIRKIPATAPLAAALGMILAAPAAHAFEASASASASASATDLDAVEVNGEKRMTSPKFTQPLVDTPQTVTIVPAELMQAQGVTTLRDALRNVPGISMQAGEGGVPAGDNLTLRGFSARTDLFIDGIRDFGGYSRDPFNLEQIEVVKGPSSAQSGRGSTGGSINLASKTARLGDFNGVSVSADDAGLLRATADFNHQIGDTAAFRVALMGHDGGINGRDHVENERYGIAPTLAFGLGTDTTTTIGLFHLEQDNVPDYGQPWVPGTNNAIPESRNQTAPVDRSTWYGILDRDYENTRTDLVTVNVRHDFNDSLSLENITRWGASHRDSVITAPRFVANVNSTDITRVSPKTRDSRDGILANVTNLRWDFATGEIEHNLLVGLELTSEESKNLARIEADPALTLPTDLYNPDPHGPYSPLVRSAIGDTHAEADSMAVYAFDTLTFNEHWELSGGLRWDRFEAESLLWQVAVPETPTTPAIPAGWITPGRTDTELNGRIGLVYKPVDYGSIYAGYGTSFNPSAEGLALNPALAAVKPEESSTFEIGTKWNLLQNRLTLTSAIFRTDKDNARIDIDPTASTTYALDGRQRVDGFEVGVAGRITRHWTVNFGYAFLDGEVLSNRAAPQEVGNELPNTPEHSANLWTSYRFNDQWEVGFGAQHVGSRYTSTNNERLAKAYTTYDMMVGYTISKAVALRLNGYNLSNKEYVDRVGGGHYIPGAERTWMLSADFSF